MYNYGTAAPCTGCANTGSNGLRVPQRNFPLYFGATEAPPETLTEKAKRILGEKNETLGVTNGTILGVAAAAGLLYYGYTKRWF
jgi:hypothetical protein